MNNHIKKPVVEIVMLKGEKGDKGDQGTSIPAGGKTGQYLQKKTDADYDYGWLDINTVDFANVSGKPDAYPTTWDNVSGKPATYPSTWDEVSGKPATYPSTWDEVSGKPSTFAPTPSVTKTITLSASGWYVQGVDYAYRIVDPLITATSNQEVVPSSSITRDQLKALQKANLYGSQENGLMYLWVYGTVPTIDIPIIVIFRGTI